MPTHLLTFSKISHLHVYLVYTFIQYQGVTEKVLNFLTGACNENAKPCDGGVTIGYEFLDESDKDNQILFYTKELDFEKVTIM